MRTTGPSQPAEFLLDVLGVLSGLQIPYAVVGALAVSYHGIPRSTAEADAVMWLTHTGKSSRDVIERLAAAGYDAESRRGDFDDPIREVVRIKDRHANRMDILLGVRGLDPAAAGRCVETSLLGSSIRIIAAEDLIAMKIFAGGPQDLNDVRGILQVSRESLSVDLLRAATARFGADCATTLEKLLTETAPSG